MEKGARKVSRQRQRNALVVDVFDFIAFRYCTGGCRYASVEQGITRGQGLRECEHKGGEGGDITYVHDGQEAF